MPQKTLWTQSVSEWLAIDGRSLFRHGITATGTPYETITQHYESKQLPPLPANIARHLAESGLHTILDLVYLQHNTQTFQWNRDVFRDTPGLNPLLHSPVPQYDTVPLLPGQCWATDNSTYPAADGFVWEYIGQMADTTDANLRLWQISPLAPHTVRLQSPSRSGGTDIICPLQSLLSGQAQKIILGGDMVDRRGVYRNIVSRKLHKLPSLPPPSCTRAPSSATPSHCFAQRTGTPHDGPVP